MENQLHKESTVPPDEKKENKSLKGLVLNFMEYTTAHGIGRLAASQTLFWKIFWSLSCIGALVMFVYQAAGLFEQYLSKPVATSVSVTFEKVCLNGRYFGYGFVCKNIFLLRVANKFGTKLLDQV